MKNKKFTYLLGLLVLFVWGIIIYRIFDTVAGGEGDFTPVQHVGEQKNSNDYSVPADTTRLLLNYKDPFKLTKQPDTAVKRITQTVEVKPSIPKPPFSWNFVRYSGYTRSSGSKKLLAVMSINGQPAILQEGEMVADIKLIKNYQDSVKVTFKGRTGYIRMQQ
ncbi:hypothetical protein [Mucilaginibacter sp. HD30]